jgi:hypothetical protein
VGVPSWAADMVNRATSTIVKRFPQTDLPRFRRHPNKREDAPGVFDGKAEGTKSRRSFSPEFKADAVRLATPAARASRTSRSVWI